MMRMLNLACGNRFHKDWENIDFTAASHEVKALNILHGLPYDGKSFDVVYSSHFLEHLNQRQADFVLSEILRVLKPGGIVRIVVPDLENICREYLNVLSDNKDENRRKKYNWIILELLDQLVRTDSGGEMLKVFNNTEIQNDDFMKGYIFQRVGETISPANNLPLTSSSKEMKKSIKFGNIKNKIFYTYIFVIKNLFPPSIKSSLVLNTTIGEKHLWMYDKYSLSEKLIKNGFIDVNFFSHSESRIPKFPDYHLDTNADGTPYKGVSSLYCEAIRP